MVLFIIPNVRIYKLAMLSNLDSEYRIINPNL